MGKRVKSQDECRTPREWERLAQHANPNVKVTQRGRHRGVDVPDYGFIATGNRPNEELPIGTNKAIRRSFVSAKLVLGLIFIGFIVYAGLALGLIG